MKREVLEKLGLVGTAVALAAALIPGAAAAAGNAAYHGPMSTASTYSITASGTYEDNANAHWQLDSDGCLRISGCGATYDNYEIEKLYEKVKSIYIGKNISSIGAESFSFMGRTKSVIFEEGSICTSIGNRAFFDCEDLTGIKIPATVTSLGLAAFGSCWSMKTVDFGGSASKLTSIGNSAFNGCEKLKSVTLPASLKTIGAYAFTSCFALEKITIPASVKSIGRGAFEDCKNLKTVVWATGCKAAVASNAFQNTAAKGLIKRGKGVAIKNIKASGKRKLVVSWTRFAGAKKYQIFYKRVNAKTYKHVTCKNTGKRKAVLRGLKSGKRYKVFVKAKASGKLLSTSKVKKSPKVK